MKTKEERDAAKAEREATQALKKQEREEVKIRRENAFIESQKLSTDDCIVFMENFKKDEEKIIDKQKDK